MKKERSSFGRQPELLVTTVRGGGPMHKQIERWLREAVRSGRLRRGAALPSTRALAQDLGVSRGVVVEAYDQLIAEGFLASRRRSRTFVAAPPQILVQEPIAPAPASFRFDFRPGLPDLRLFPHAAFARAARRVLRSLDPAHLGYGNPQGTQELRGALAEYLGRVRHVVAGPRDIVVCSGIAQGLGIVARALVRRGTRRMAVEDPCHPGVRDILREAGLQAVPVPVDSRGVRVDRLAQLDAEAVLVTPAHQFPTGVVLAPERRQELCAWAARRNALVIEDDYDAEYHYDRPGIGALQGLDPERIVYAGSASKVLAPALRLGWIVVPRAWRDSITELKRIADLGSAGFDQSVYADFLGHGDLDRHLRRMRHVYRRRRDALVGAIARHLAGWEASGMTAGLHLVVELPAGLDERTVARAAASQSMRVYPMREYRIRRSGKHPAALVLGYAGLDEAQIREAVRRLATAIAAGEG